MGQVNNVLNRIDAYNDLNVGFCKREIQSRATNLFVTAPLEFTEIIKNIFMTPVHAASTVLKTTVKATALVTGSISLKKFEEKLPGFNDLLRTISKVFAYTIGTFLSATVGVLFPNINYKLHCALGLATNPRLEEMHFQFEDNEELTLEEQELLNNLNLAFAMARQIEEEARQTMQATANRIKETCEAAAQTIKHAAETSSTAIKKAGEDVKPEPNAGEERKEYVIESIEKYETSFGQVVNSAFDGGKNLLSKTLSTISN
jgi:hypothetical protein